MTHRNTTVDTSTIKLLSFDSHSRVIEMLDTIFKDEEYAIHSVIIKQKVNNDHLRRPLLIDVPKETNLHDFSELLDSWGYELAPENVEFLLFKQSLNKT